MLKDDFLKEAMNLKVKELIQETYDLHDDSSILTIYNDIDEEFQKVFEGNKYQLVHDEANFGYLNYSEYESAKDYWISEYVLGNIKVEVKINLKDLDSFESWDKETFN